jgi:hypothetical protein
MLIQVTNTILLRGEYLIIGKDNLVVINEVSHIPGEEDNGPKDWVDCLVPPMLDDLTGVKMSPHIRFCGQTFLAPHFSSAENGAANDDDASIPVSQHT